MVYRDGLPVCPRCGRAFARIGVGTLRFERCPACSGAWVEGSTLAALWQSMGGARLALRPRESDHAPIPCPRCRTPMAAAALLAVPVDRCAEHGIWFDTEELSTALAGATLPEDDWLRTFAGALRALR
jgi:Zn-finger nucleic acid-binding protein